jgi:hypothetical protein
MCSALQTVALIHTATLTPVITFQALSYRGTSQLRSSRTIRDVTPRSCTVRDKRTVPAQYARRCRTGTPRSQTP